MATNILDEESCTSKVFSLSYQPNCSFFQDSSTDLVSEITADCINDVEPEIVENFTAKSKLDIGGGITCCVSTCFKNAVRKKELPFYVISNDNQITNRWLYKLRKKYFVPLSPLFLRQKNVHGKHSDLKYASSLYINQNNQ